MINETNYTGSCLHNQDTEEKLLNACFCKSVELPRNLMEIALDRAVKTNSPPIITLEEIHQSGYGLSHGTISKPCTEIMYRAAGIKVPAIIDKPEFCPVFKYTDITPEVFERILGLEGKDIRDAISGLHALGFKHDSRNIGIDPRLDPRGYIIAGVETLKLDATELLRL